MPAGQVWVDRADIARLKPGAIRCFHDLNRQLVPHDTRIFEKRMLALKNVIIGPANADASGPDKGIPRTSNRNVPRFYGQAAGRGADESVDLLHR